MAEVKKRIVVGATGASGLPLLYDCLKIIKETKNWESILIMSDSAKLTLKHEMNLLPEEIYNLADLDFEPDEIMAQKLLVAFFSHGRNADRPCVENIGRNP